MLPAAVMVLRDGAQTHTPAKDLVIGDIVGFISLNRISADEA